MDPCQADVARPSQACTPRRARDRAFNPGAARILRLKRLCRFPLPGDLEGLILRLGPDGDVSAGDSASGADTVR